MSALIKWLESHQLPCLNKRFSGIDCPGCGMQTAIIELLKGNIIESIKVYPALIPTLLMIAFLMVHLVFKFKNGTLILKITFIATCTIIIANYIYKLITV